MDIGDLLELERSFQRDRIARPTAEIENIAAFCEIARESLDLRLAKDFPISSGVRLGVQADVFNVTNFKNFCGFEGFYLSTNLGKPNCQYNTRRAQLGVNVGF